MNVKLNTHWTKLQYCTKSSHRRIVQPVLHFAVLVSLCLSSQFAQRTVVRVLCILTLPHVAQIVPSLHFCWCISPRLLTTTDSAF